ncbi:helix-turn-helix domain-containing protein [Kitasatospora sp. NPDC008050]|uniref:helix-turn-helix domain-containing protein n=1 Tax=Kitasatospora sp. NPDC008050 TaxID=3364021 RepID=UPI0036E07AC8
MRIAHYRKLRHLTQRGLAERAHISYSMLTKIEQGDRPTSPATIAALARALQIPVAELTGQPYLSELQQDQLDGLIQPVREALDVYDLGVDPEVAPRALAELAAHAEALCAAVREARLRDVASQLPGLITEVTSAAHASPSAEAWTVLASTYRTAYDVTTKLGFADLCAVALDRMAWAAERASDPVVAGVRQYLRSLAYLRAGQYRTGERLVTLGMGMLQQADASRERDVAVGQLHLGAAVIAARAQDSGSTEGHLSEAGRVAELTGPAERVHWLSFGPTNVVVHRVSVMAELSQYQQAVSAAADVVIPESWPASRRSHHLAEVAHAQLWIGQNEAALRNLQAARAAAPQQTRYHPVVRETVAGLVAARRAAPDSLANLAAWVGI